MGKKMLLVGLALMVALLGVIGCASGAPVPGEKSPLPSVFPTPTPAPAAPPGSEFLKREVADEDWQMEDSGIVDRMIVRSGDISLVVEDISIAMDRIVQLAEDFQGYVVSSRRWGEGGGAAGSITIRVPVEDFDNAMKAIHTLAVEVTSESTSSKDVTEEYVDLESRLGNLEATEEQLLKLMEKAETVEDILNIQRELSKTRGDIEQAKGRMQYLERTSATSLIAVNLEQAKLDAEFTANKTTVKEGEEIQFYSQISGGFTPYSYEWDFSDDTTSTDSNPIHTYKATGDYTVSLKVTDDRDNTVTESRTDYITVLPGWSGGDVVRSAWNGLVTFGHMLGTAAIWMGIFCFAWIPPLVIWLRRRRRRKA